MMYFSSRNKWGLWPFLACAIAYLTSTGASALSYYIVVQPIDVCFTQNGTLICPQVNNLAPPSGFTYQSALSNPGTTNIGFFDATTGKDLTRVMLNQIGVDVTWNALAQFNSDSTSNNSYCVAGTTGCPGTATTVTATDWSHLHVIDTTQVTSVPSGCTFTSAPRFISCDFLTLSQQPSISKGIVPKTTIPRGVPISSNLTTINMFFTENLDALNQTGVLYGFSWINNNGVAISQDAFSPPLGITPRLDTLGHESGHNLALTHTDFGTEDASGNPIPSNLMVAGCCTSNGADLRTEPSTTGCDLQSSTYPNGGALYDIKTGQCGTSAPNNPIAEHLTLGTCTSISPANSCTNQQGAIEGPNSNGLPLSGFLNPVQTQTTTASSTCKKNCGTAPTSSPSPYDTINSNCSITFDVAYPGDSSGRIGEYTVEMILTPPRGFTLINNTFQPLTKGFVSKASIVNGQLIIIMNAPPHQFPPNQMTGSHFIFVQGISKNTSQCSYSVRDLDSEMLADQDRMHFGWILSDGYFVTSTFAFEQAATTNPDPAIRSQIVDPNFVGFGALACTTTTSCPNPQQTGIEDGDVNTQGGQPSSD